MAKNNLTLLGVGDIILRTPDLDPMYTLVAPVLRSGDVVIGQGEIPFTSRSAITAPWSALGHPDGLPRGCDPKNMEILPSLGFNVIHLAGNHIWDSGIPGIEDTIKGLRKLGITTVGAGMNLDEARSPAIIERKATKFGFLSYNCVGPKETWANPLKPGCAWVRIVTAFEMDHPTPGAPPSVYTFAEPDSLKAMLDDIHKLRPLCDVLVVHFHKGIGMTPIKIAMYEQTVSYAAIDAGADLILAEHAHILKGIEMYNGKAIFHGLANFVARSSLNPDKPPPKQPEWMVQQKLKIWKESFGQEPVEGQSWDVVDGSDLTIIAKCIIDRKKITRISYLPCLINNKGQIELLKHAKKGQKVFDYMEKITRGADLNARYKWDGDEVLVSSG